MAEFEGRCMKCKDKRKMKEPAAAEIKPGTWAVRGKCTVCGTNMFKIVGKEKPKI
jgi:Zn finger protein HypA/HybF involved in hydrogenase expression